MRRLAWVCLAAGLFADDAHAFRYFCASLNAGGGAFSDGCGACDETSAPLWQPSTVPFRFDSGTGGSGISSAQWTSDVAQALSTWNALPGSSLVLQDAGATTTRSFGGNSAAHEIFWANSDSEWSSATGFAPNGGAAGVTDPSYGCDGNGDGRREPFTDGDIILNGAPSSGMRWNCAGLNCFSSYTVLAHEIGHAIGLGHPCRECTDAMMSATLIANPQAPLPEDILPILLLYAPPGGAGVPCDVSGDCAGALSCESVATSSLAESYCTTACSGGCPGGFSCDLGRDLCVLSTTTDAFPKPIGAPCSFTCVDDCFTLGGPGVIGPGCNACLVGSAGDAVCAAGCNPTTGAGCSATEACSAIVVDGTPSTTSGGCIARQALGDPCNQAFPCLPDLVCVPGSPAATCHTACDPAAPACGAGESCSDVGGAFACVVGVDPGGFDGESCAGGGDCADGYACANLNGASTCWRRCVDDTACRTGETCRSFNGGAFHLCARVDGLGDDCGAFNDLCPSGTSCIAGHDICSVACSSADDCGATGQCVDVGGDLLCVPAGAGQPGEPCTSTADCVGGTACASDGTSALCRVRCASDVDCAPGSCVVLGGESVCVAPAAGEGEGEGDAGEGEGDGEGEGEGEGEGAGCGCAGTSTADGALWALALWSWKRGRGRRS